MTQLEKIESMAGRDLSTLSTSDVASMASTFDNLNRHIRRLNRATTLPLGVDRAFAYVPWFGSRYQAVRDLLEMSQHLSSAGKTLTNIGRESLVAVDDVGIVADSAPPTTTWLEVVHAHEQSIVSAGEDIKQAQELYLSLDEGLLPSQVRSRFAELEHTLFSLDPDLLTDESLTTLTATLGIEQRTRYLVLFQNPAELRPSGGFPGTVALVEFDRGQLRSYEFRNVHDLTQDYMRQRVEKRPEPWPIEQYFPQDGFLLQDANWWADFPRSGAEILSMYAETDWPPIDGVIAVQPAAVSDLLRITGPVTVDVEGETRTITPANLHDEIERQRRIRQQNQDVETTHKELLETVGVEIIDRLSDADTSTFMAATRAMKESADRRDIQAYVESTNVQEQLEERGWAGRLVPDSDVSTLAVTFGNVAIAKTSLDMHPAIELELDPEAQGQRQATLRIQLDHRGTGEHDPLQHGFQRWWIEVLLPDGSVLTSSSVEPAPDPEAPNGGSYAVDLFPQETREIVVEFTLPTSDELYLRRQPGLSTVQFTVEDNACGKHWSTELDRDRVAPLASICP